MYSRERQARGTPALNMGSDINREELASHPVNEALQKPFGGINPCCHLLLVLVNEKY